jgi:hypothetical protein
MRVSKIYCQKRAASAIGEGCCRSGKGGGGQTGVDRYEMETGACCFRGIWPIKFPDGTKSCRARAASRNTAIHSKAEWVVFPFPLTPVPWG